MPELPEVETIKRQLDKLISGKKVKKVQVSLPKMVKLALAKFKKIVIGAKIKNIERRAKILVFNFTSDWSMLVHLKMSGRLIFRKKSEQLGEQDLKWNHLIYHFSDGSRLFHNDLRQFGYVKLVKTNELADFFKKEKIGPEPLDKDFVSDDFFLILKTRPNVKIKQFLMDPKNIAGIGNIYSDEILFFARVHPFVKVKDLKLAEIRRIFDGIKKILAEALKSRGTSQNDYLDAFGQKGDYVSRLLVYGRENEKCKICGGIIQRRKMNGRSAHFCPECQYLAQLVL
jgi:formamidopyrimidine-DNA glycosylase